MLELIRRLEAFGYHWHAPSEEPINDGMARQTIEMLLRSRERPLISAIPVVLARCSGLNIPVDLSSLRHSVANTASLKEILDRLLLACNLLFQRLGIPDIHGLGAIAAELESLYGPQDPGVSLPRAEGGTISLQRLENTLRQSLDHHPDNASRYTRAGDNDSTLTMYRHLAILFPAKQRDLIEKRLNGERFSKTEREYYSRIVRKRLEALADGHVHALARKLTDK